MRLTGAVVVARLMRLDRLVHTYCPYERRGVLGRYEPTAGRPSRPRGQGFHLKRGEKGHQRR